MAILDDTRADWNARPPLRPLTHVPWSERIGVSWHWIGPGKGPSATGPHQRCLDQVREWQRQHQAKNWKDVGYPALICQHARAIEGRGLDTEGSHSPGVNWEHTAVQFMCGEDSGPPTADMIARAVRLRADIGQLGKNIRRDWAHRDDPEASTACPGPWITNWVHTGGPTKHTPAPDPAPQEDEVTPQDIKAVVDGVLGARVIPANMLGVEGQFVNLPRALDLVMRWSLEARDNAIVARSVAEAQAAKGEALTPAEIVAIGEAVGKQLANGFDVNLTPKAGA